MRDTLFLIGGAAFVWWMLKKKVGAPGGALDVNVARPIAYVISSLTLPAAVHINGGVVFPDGGYVSFDAITQAGSKVDNQQRFMWRGMQYRIVPPRRGDDNYNAIRV